jgi:hypothetical protein
MLRAVHVMNAKIDPAMLPLIGGYADGWPYK